MTKEEFDVEFPSPDYDFCRELLFRVYCELQPNDYPVSDGGKVLRYTTEISVDTYNLISALARDTGKDFSWIFAEALNMFCGFLVKFDSNHYRETRYYLK